MAIGFPASIFTKGWLLRSAPGEDNDWGYAYNDEDVCLLSNLNDCDIINPKCPLGIIPI